VWPSCYYHRKLSRRALRVPSKLHSGRKVLSRDDEITRPRIISTGLLHTLPRFHIQPIDLVVYQDPYSL
jgi:hypothetical protein